MGKFIAVPHVKRSFDWAGKSYKQGDIFEADDSPNAVKMLNNKDFIKVEFVVEDAQPKVKKAVKRGS